MEKGLRPRSTLKPLTRNWLAITGLIVICSVTLTAFFAPIIVRYDPGRQDLSHQFAAPNREYWFGTDYYGRDIYSRVIWGSRISLFVGVLAACFGIIIGVPLGLAAGFFGQRIDNIIMRIIDMLMAFPPLILAMAIVAALGTENLANITIAIGMALIPQFTRVARAETLSIKENDYIEAARSLGASSWRIILVHVLPNCLAPIIVMFTLFMANAIRVEASLSFLGLGVQPPTPTWGNIISDGRDYLHFAPWISTISGAAIMVTVFAFNIVGDALRDAWDPRLRGKIR